MKVLIIEDEKHIAEAIAAQLTENGFSADTEQNGESGLDCALSGIYDIIILDIMLPGINGRDILKALRKEKITTPVIMLTAKSDSCTDYLNLGADDYIQKPYRKDELLARIRAVLRRGVDISDIKTPSFSDISLSVSELRLSRGDKSVTLTRKEAFLMEYLIANHDIVLSKEQIIQKLWGFDSNADDNHVEVYISFLRKKLKFLGSDAEIRTIRGVGYSLKEIEEC